LPARLAGPVAGPAVPAAPAPGLLPGAGTGAPRTRPGPDGLPRRAWPGRRPGGRLTGEHAVRTHVREVILRVHSGSRARDGPPVARLARARRPARGLAGAPVRPGWRARRAARITV